MKKYILIWLESGKAEELEGPILNEWTKGLEVNEDGWFKVSLGEEDMLLVIEEGNKWYSKVDELNLDSVKKEIDFSNGKYDGSLWEEWVELIEESFEKLVD